MTKGNHDKMGLGVAVPGVLTFRRAASKGLAAETHWGWEEPGLAGQVGVYPHLYPPHWLPFSLRNTAYPPSTHSPNPTCLWTLPTPAPTLGMAAHLNAYSLHCSSINSLLSGAFSASRHTGFKRNK